MGLSTLSDCAHVKKDGGMGGSNNYLKSRRRSRLSSAPRATFISGTAGT